MALPRSEKWHLLAILTEVLRNEEEGTKSQIPQWQVEKATQAKMVIKSGKVKPLSQEQFWAVIDAKVGELEQQTGS